MKTITCFLIGFLFTFLGHISMGWIGYLIGLLMALIIILTEIILEYIEFAKGRNSE